MPDSSLLVLFDEVRGKTLLLLEGVSEEEARWSPPGLHNHILWHAGHSFVLVETLATEALGGQPQIPDGWFEMFSWRSEPARVAPQRWPPLAKVVAQLKSQHARLRSQIARLDPERLASPMPAHPGRTRGYAIVHGLHDEACHSGEIWLLRKLLRLNEFA